MLANHSSQKEAASNIVGRRHTISSLSRSTMAADVPCCEPMFWVYIAISAALVAFAGLMSGLTLGLMSLSLLDLEVLIKAGQPEDRKNAEKIFPIVKNQHLLLCTLLICNAMAMEALPIFLDSVLLPWCAILVSVTLILAFGEIIPQAVCSRYGLTVGAKLSVLVRLLVIVVFPVAYPLSKLLDLLLGKGHSVLRRRAELKILVNMHGNKAGKGGELTNDETTIISGALDLTQKTVEDAMTPMSEIFSLELNSKLNEETMNLLLSKGHSRVPVYSETPENIIGLILVKNLIKCRPENEPTIKSLGIRRIPRIPDCLPLYEILKFFQKGHSHMAVVVKSKSDLKNTAENAMAKHDMVKITISSNSSPALDRKTRANDLLESFSNSGDEIIGLITMEDVLEELLQEAILDETDAHVYAKSPGAASANSHLINWRTLVASPLSSSALYTNSPVLSSYHHSPVLRSPLSPFIRSPFVRPTLSASPGKSTSNSPAIPISSSPSSHRVSRKTYEKLKRPSETPEIVK